MAKEEGIEVQGTIIEKHPGGTFEVRLDDKHVVLAQIAGKLRKHRIRILTGDRSDGRTLTLRPDARAHHLSFSFVVIRRKQSSQRRAGRPPFGRSQASRVPPPRQRHGEVKAAV